ncbi:MAG: histidine phosphatase family protein, partial [Oscillospiraceae bacterium]|nr:histidine phosphatase family protein [Oscillospiraceae bacterium]
MKLLIIRHGQSEADLLNVYEGRADFELTELGHEQAKQMSKFVNNNYKIYKIYSSPLKRAVQTANHLSEETGAEIILDNKLMEFDNGLIAGLKKEVADAKYPMVMNIPIYTSVYEQETLMDFRLRADCFLSEIIK